MTIDPFLAAWSENGLARTSIALRRGSTVTGVCDRHVGPSWQYATVSVHAEPAERFSVSIALDSDRVRALQADRWIDEAVFGIIDTLMTHRSSPVLGMTIRVLDVGEDPIRSSRVAFRRAGRDAALRLLREDSAGDGSPAR